MTHNTIAEILKSEFLDSDVFAWANYTAINSETMTGRIGIKRLEDISGIPPDECLYLSNKGGAPEWLANGANIKANDKCTVEINMPTLAKRDAVMDDIDAGLLLTSYNFLYDIVDHPDAGETLLKTILEFTLTIQ